MKKLALTLVLVGCCLARVAIAQPNDTMPVLRHSPEFAIHQPDGKEIVLSSLQGKVVALMFVHTTCPICQQASQVFSKLAGEYGPQFQPVIVAFNSKADERLPEFVKQFNIRYPVGFSRVEDVSAYLGIPASERFTIPQIVWIDRNGDIRAQTPRLASEFKATENCWRNIIGMLLKEVSPD